MADGVHMSINLGPYTFQLTASQGGWLTVSFHRARIIVFQLTASQGGWQPSAVSLEMYSRISTHSLTRRLTVCCRSSAAWTAFQLTASQGGWRKAQVVREVSRHFNSQPHKEADRNFRQKHIYPKLIFLLIIHISLIFYSNHHILNYFSCKLYVFPGANVLEYFCELTFRTIILRYL